MKMTKLILLVVATMYGTSALAAAFAGTATAEVIAPVTLTNPTSMDFGTFAPDAGGDAVSLTNDAVTVRTITTGSLAGGSAASGEFVISGATGLAVTISVTDGAGDLINGATTLVFTPTAASLGATHTITGVAASDTFYVGGDITIPAAAPVGVYTSATAYTVTVNYQ